MSIAKIEPTTKVREWVNRINLSFDEIRKKEFMMVATSVANQSKYEFPISVENREIFLKRFDGSAQYTVQYGGVILVPEDYVLSGSTLEFVNGPPLEDGYPIIVRYIARGETQSVQQ